MKNMPPVSVVIPVYNRVTSLLKAIQSVLIQGDFISEIIIIDDASTADIEECVASIKTDKIRYFRNSQNLGAAVSRNIGVSKALGEWIAFLDSDDYWYENKLKKQFEAIFKNESDVCYSTGDTNNSKQMIANYSGNLLIPLLQKGNIVVGGFSGIVIKKAVFLTVGGINEALRSRQDYELHLRLSLNDASYSFVKDALLYFKTMGSDRITTNHYSRILGIIKVLKIHKDLFLASKSYRYIVDFEELIYRLSLLRKHKYCAMVLFYFLKHFQTSLKSRLLTLFHFFKAIVKSGIKK